ncbi:SDR family oxidoreductase [Demequina sp. TTPB684]|uniref:SDR family oxidoreductase n=1 Tax=unclassified Demequina TaxID=2620311 RepID=UPI001CF34610|nr:MULTISPECIES: SDR family oxidoreductase [unclassified Demequina]MCB2412328.1 SDR family oxidoreductase [Demequina sp. TTPB684]UPU89477.1 SDR family oxidoreductase [Demequina sp. TMPB413]
MSFDQLTHDNPAERFANIEPKAQGQEFPGKDADLKPHAELGETTYRGTGRLIGRKALVTGGDSGIGAATAIAFAREGADVALSFLPEEQEDAEHIASVIREDGRKAVLLPGDIRDAAWCQSLVDQAVEALGGLDILVNNAGRQTYVNSIEELSDEEFDATMKTNIYAMHWITKAAMPHLKPGAAIINTTSVQAYKPSPIIAHYAATKAAIKAWTKAMSQDLAPEGIRVNAVAPGPVWTPLQVTQGQPPEKLEGFGQSTALGRAGQPVEMAPAFVFLASPEASFVVGEVVNVNGGQPTP